MDSAQIAKERTAYLGPWPIGPLPEAAPEKKLESFWWWPFEGALLLGCIARPQWMPPVLASIGGAAAVAWFVRPLWMHILGFFSDDIPHFPFGDVGALVVLTISFMCIIAALRERIPALQYGIRLIAVRGLRRWFWPSGAISAFVLVICATWLATPLSFGWYALEAVRNAILPSTDSRHAMSEVGVMLMYLGALIVYWETLRSLHAEPGDEPAWWGSCEVAAQLRSSLAVRMGENSTSVVPRAAIDAHIELGRLITDYHVEECPELDPERAYDSAATTTFACPFRSARVRCSGHDGEHATAVTRVLATWAQTVPRTGTLARAEVQNLLSIRSASDAECCVSEALADAVQKLAAALAQNENVDAELLAGIIDPLYVDAAARHYRFIAADYAIPVNVSDAESRFDVSLLVCADILALGHTFERVGNRRMRSWAFMRFFLGPSPARSILRRFLAYSADLPPWADAGRREQAEALFSMREIVHDAVALDLLDRRNASRVIDNFFRLVAELRRAGALRPNAMQAVEQWIDQTAATLAMTQCTYRSPRRLTGSPGNPMPSTRRFLPSSAKVFFDFLRLLDSLLHEQEQLLRVGCEHAALLRFDRKRGHFSVFQEAIRPYLPHLCGFSADVLTLFWKGEKVERTPPGKTRGENLEPRYLAATLQPLAPFAIFVFLNRVRRRLRAAATPVGNEHPSWLELLWRLGDGDWRDFAGMFHGRHARDRYRHRGKGKFRETHQLSQLLLQIDGLLPSPGKLWVVLWRLKWMLRRYPHSVPVHLAIAYARFQSAYAEDYERDRDERRSEALEYVWAARGLAEIAYEATEEGDDRNAALQWIAASDHLLSRIEETLGRRSVNDDGGAPALCRAFEESGADLAPFLPYALFQPDASTFLGQPFLVEERIVWLARWASESRKAVTERELQRIVREMKILASYLRSFRADDARAQRCLELAHLAVRAMKASQ